MVAHFVQIIKTIFTFFFCSQVDRDGSGYIELAELKQALDLCGFKIPSYEVRRMIEDVDRDQHGPGKGRLSFDEFEHVRIDSYIILLLSN